MIQLLRRVDGLMTLPPDLKREFKQAVKEIAEEKTMPILMDIEIEAMAEGALAAKRHAILQFLRARFGEVPARVDLALSSCSEISRLDRLVVAAALAKDLEDFEREFGLSSK